MNWLITGGCGFIGRSFISRLIGEGEHSVRVVDNLSVGTREALAAVCDFRELEQGKSSEWDTGVELIVGDISDVSLLDSVTAGADCLVHLAANTGVGPSVEDPLLDCKTNVLGTLNALEAARRSHVRKFVFASSGAPLGVQNPPLHEELAPHPASPYGASKLAGEGYCSAYFHCFGVETVTLRFGNVYGPSSGHKMSVVAKFIKQALAGETLEIYGDGSQTRDFIFIADLVDAIYRAGTLSGIGGETFQIATSLETTIQELTTALVDVLEASGIEKPKVVFTERRTGDVERNFSDTSKARQQLGWSSQIDLSRGLTKTVESFLK
jgi:UDP-glucose 4-epimerase